MITRALVTGGGGFIGLRLAEKLVALGCEVDIIDNFSRGVRDARLERLGNDALRRASPDSVLVYFSTSEIHLGSEASGTLTFPTRESAPVVVGDVAEPRATYMLSKLYGEALCAHSGLSQVILRPHNVYGPRMGEAHVIPQLIRRLARARAGERVVIRSPTATRCFCYIDDAVRQIIAVAAAEHYHGQIVNIGNANEEVEIIDLAERIRACLGSNVDLEPGAHEPGSPMRRLPDLAKISSLVGQVAQVPLSQGLRRTVDYYLPAGPQRTHADPSCELNWA